MDRGEDTASLCAMSPGLRVAAFLIAIFIPAAATTGFQPLFLADRGLDAAAIGQILAVATFARVLAMPGWGWLADHVGRRREVLLMASLLAALAGFAWLGAHGYAALFAVTLLYGVGASCLMPMADAVALTLAHAGRMDYGPVRAVGSIAFMATIAFSGWLTGVAGSAVLPWLVGVPYLAACGFALLLPDTQGPRALGRAGGFLGVLASRPVRLAMLASALLQGGHAAVYALGSLHWRAHGVPEGVIGLLWATGVASEIVLFFVARPIAGRIGPAGLTALAALAATLRWAVTAHTTALPALFAMQMLHGATYGMTHISAMLLLSRNVAPEHAAVAQTLHAAIGVALPVGALMWLCGQAYDGSGAVFLAMAGLGLLALPVAWRIARLPGRERLA